MSDLVKVKPLVWRNVGRCVEWSAHDEKTHLFLAHGGGCFYEVASGQNGWWAKWEGDFHARGLPSIEDAKAAAQADYAARILSAIDTAAIARLTAQVEALTKERDEAFRRRDAWRAKAEGFDAIRLALREKVGAPWPANMSRLLWAGVAADEKKRADDAEAQVEALTGAAQALLDHVEDSDLDRAIPGQCTVCHSYRQPLHDAIAAAAQEAR